jgi:hypothetical protein
MFGNGLAYIQCEVEPVVPRDKAQSTDVRKGWPIDPSEIGDGYYEEYVFCAVLSLF